MLIATSEALTAKAQRTLRFAKERLVIALLSILVQVLKIVAGSSVQGFSPITWTYYVAVFRLQRTFKIRRNIIVRAAARKSETSHIIGPK